MTFPASVPGQNQRAPQACGQSVSRPSGEGDVFEIRAEVVSNERVNADYRHLIVKAGNRVADAKAGQFFNIACPVTVSDQPYLRRPMSIYRTGQPPGHLQFLYKVTGAGTRGLATLRPGDHVEMLGPLGNGFWLDPTWKNIVVLGRGVGLATLAPLAELARGRGVGVTAILSARRRELVMSTERFIDAGARVKIVTDEDGSSEPANIQCILNGLIEAQKADAFFTCGSNRLMLLMKQLASMFHIPGQVALEQQMACGLGMCFCCVREFQNGAGKEQRRVCLEGPVFPISEALSW